MWTDKPIGDIKSFSSGKLNQQQNEMPVDWEWMNLLSELRQQGYSGRKIMHIINKMRDKYITK